MKKSDDYKISKNADYVKMMSETLLAIPREKIPPSTVQAASTQESLNTTDEQYAEKVKKMFESGSWKAPVYTEEEMLDRLHNTYGLEMIDMMQRKRRESKNTIGESKKSATSPERRQKAIEVWNYTEPAPYTPEEKLEIKEIEHKKEKPPEPVVVEEWKPMTTFQAIIHWCKGGKIKPYEDK